LHFIPRLWGYPVVLGLWGLCHRLDIVLSCIHAFLILENELGDERFGLPVGIHLMIVQLPFSEVKRDEHRRKSIEAIIQYFSSLLYPTSKNLFNRKATSQTQ
jgi:hypothetical protein